MKGFEPFSGPGLGIKPGTFMTANMQATNVYPELTLPTGRIILTIDTHLTHLVAPVSADARHHSGRVNLRGHPFIHR